MKKTIITATAVLFTAIGAFAQSMTQQAAPNAQAGSPQQMQHTMPSPEERAKRMSDQMNTAVQLTPEQYKKVMDVNKDFMAKMDAFRTANQANQGQAQAGAANNRGAQFKQMMEEKDTKLKAILTPEQWQKWQDSRKMAPRPGQGNMQPAHSNAVPQQH